MTNLFVQVFYERINKIKFKIGISLLILILGWLIIFAFNSREKSSGSIVELNVSVSYDENKFIIRNNDTVDFVHADLAINEYYKVRNINLKKGETYTIWQVEFLHHNGRRFPPRQKPQKFSIWCEINNGKNGFYNTNVKLKK